MEGGKGRKKFDGLRGFKASKKTRQVPGFSILIILDQHQNV